MQLTKQQAKQAMFILVTIVTVVIVIDILVQGSSMNSSSNSELHVLSEEEKARELCEEKMSQDFQLIEPEFVWYANEGNEDNSLFGHVIYQNDVHQPQTTEFECVVGNNGNGVWINWDRENNPNAEDIIYDDWN